MTCYQKVNIEKAFSDLSKDLPLQFQTEGFNLKDEDAAKIIAMIKADLAVNTKGYDQQDMKIENGCRKPFCKNKSDVICDMCREDCCERCLRDMADRKFCYDCSKKYSPTDHNGACISCINNAYDKCWKCHLYYCRSHVDHYPNSNTICHQCRDIIADDTKDIQNNCSVYNCYKKRNLRCSLCTAHLCFKHTVSKDNGGLIDDIYCRSCYTKSYVMRH